MLALLTAATVSLLLGAAAGWLARAHHDQAQAPMLDPFTARVPRPRSDDDETAWQGAPAPSRTEAALIAAMIRSHDLGDGVRAQVRDDLAAIGVDLIDAPAGSVFDSRRHKAVASVAAAGQHVGTVAELIRPGWSGPGGDVIRFPEVSVYASAAAAAR